jgi:hypothetical protein
MRLHEKVQRFERLDRSVDRVVRKANAEGAKPVFEGLQEI